MQEALRLGPATDVLGLHRSLPRFSRWVGDAEHQRLQTQTQMSLRTLDRAALKTRALVQQEVDPVLRTLYRARDALYRWWKQGGSKYLFSGSKVEARNTRRNAERK